MITTRPILVICFINWTYIQHSSLNYLYNIYQTSEIQCFMAKINNKLTISNFKHTVLKHWRVSRIFNDLGVNNVFYWLIRFPNLNKSAISCYSARQTLRVLITTVFEHTSNLEIKNKIGYLNYFLTGCRLIN